MWLNYLSVWQQITLTNTETNDPTPSSSWEAGSPLSDKKLPTIYRTRMIISMFTTTSNLSLFRVKLHHPTPSNSTSWRYTLILYSHLLLILWNCLYLRVPSPKLFMHLYSSEYLSQVQIISTSCLPRSRSSQLPACLALQLWIVALSDAVVITLQICSEMSLVLWIRMNSCEFVHQHLQHSCHYFGSYNHIGHHISSVSS